MVMLQHQLGISQLLWMGGGGGVTLQRRSSTVLNYGRNNASSVPGVLEWVPDLLLKWMVCISRRRKRCKHSAVGMSRSETVGLKLFCPFCVFGSKGTLWYTTPRRPRQHFKKHSECSNTSELQMTPREAQIGTFAADRCGWRRAASTRR